MKAEVLATYNIPSAESPYYEIDNLVPLATGSANVVANLWPEPWAEAIQKDALEVELQRRVCHRLSSRAEAQYEIADDWTTAYELYVGGLLVARSRVPGNRSARAAAGLEARLKPRRFGWRGADYRATSKCIPRGSPGRHVPLT